MGGTGQGVASVSADDLDAEQIKQLHEATLKASDSCFELKKLCATVLAPTVTVVTIVTGKRLDAAVFAVGLLVVLAFWLADAVGYYYQRTLRHLMDRIWERRAFRCVGEVPMVPKPVGAPTWPGSAFNKSMGYYGILAGLLLLGFVLFWFGVISSPESIPNVS